MAILNFSPTTVISNKDSGGLARQYVTDRMASFSGTPADVNKFLGPLVRNLIQSMTRSHKWRQRTCQGCGEARPLEAAHVKGMGRKALILSALGYDEKSPMVQIHDLDTALARIIAAHRPIENVFRFLCADCHGAYDAA